MRKIGVDIGKARIGLAMSDELGIIASPVETLQAKGLETDVQTIANFAQENKVDTIVLGLPLMLDGTCGEMGEYAKEFAQKLKEITQANVVLWDERLTSYEADNILKAKKIKDWRERKKLLDQISACIILQSFLDK